MSVILETSLGDITLDLYTEERPRCCVNFLKLCKIKYYNFCLFHSVQAGLVAQTGDPTGTGKGGESIFGKLYGDQAKYFEWEVKPKMKHRKLGSLSMVNNGDNLHGSQFFITLGENIDYLDNVHTVFGEVAEGFEVLEKLNEAYVDKDSIPYRDIRIFHTIVLEDPLDDPTGLGEFIPDRSPEPTREQLDSGRIGVDEDIDKTKDMTREQVQELLEGKEAKANAQILTMIGDLPTEDIEAPDNVLFVCKLNPVTSEEDLEIIFSRFGPILNCEVIKDHKTEDSLQYAFIEFKDPKHCENAYFKMDNVLIDDRRIHVDFSQSVSKIKWKGKGKGVEIEQKEQKEPGYKIIDPSSRDIGNYDYVFDEGDAGSSKQHKKKKKKHKREQESPSRDDDHRRKHGSKHERHRSRSSSPKTRGNKSDKRSRREDERSSDRYSREDTRHRDRGSYKDREKYRDSRR